MMELHAPPIGEILEIRKRGSQSKLFMRGRFPYNRNATMSDGGRGGGRPKKERIASRAFAYRVERPEEEIRLLSGHRYDKPLASRRAGSLELEDSDDALSFEATIVPELAEATWVRDMRAAFDAGLATGISPGFRIPPPRAVKDAETVVEEDPREGTALIRIITAALLYELSVVTAPAYEEATVEQLEARSWDALPTLPTGVPTRLLGARRWRL